MGIATFVLIFTACQKNPLASTPIELMSTCKFTANGINYEMNGSLTKDTSTIGSILQKRHIDNYKYYTLSAQNYLSTLTRITLVLNNTDSIAIKSYKSYYPYAKVNGDALINGIYYGQDSWQLGDNGIVNITRLHDGVYADGTFTAQMTKANFMQQGGTTKMIITNGEFKNVKILQ